MILVGMLDSPFVRRVAIELKINRIAFEHRSISVFRQMDEFARINPLLKAPSLVCDDGEVLSDSSLILDYIWNVVAPGRGLMPAGPARQHALRLVGLGLVAAEKAVQILYESKRPETNRYEPWLERVTSQMHQAFSLLEPEVARAAPWLFGERISQADISIATAWKFQEFVLKDVVPAGQYPHLEAFSARAEALPEFLASPLE